MDGVALGARFSIATNRLQYCGPDGAETALYRAITEGTDLPAARRALSRFEALVPYLETIGRKHQLDPFDERVVEAYWLGNDLLDSFERSDFLGLLDRLVRRGLPRSLATRLAQHLPGRPIPHHMFHVGFVGVGNVTGHVPTTLANMESCRPAWATVVALDSSSVTVESPALRVERGRLSLSGTRTEALPYDPKVIPDLKVGEPVVVHWRTLALRAAAHQLAALRRYTELSLAAANEALPALGVFGPPAPSGTG
ncbi:MAG TPA: DUF6390 family protein [Thermoplasmata archaeon]|nr:DUF6390 family protein [Thermoplasmata archaeon]